MKNAKLKLKIKNFEFEITICNLSFEFFNYPHQRGYIALTSILVISAVILTIGLSVSLLSISEGQMSLAEKKKEETIDFVEGCLAEILLKLNEDNTVATAVTLPEGSCSVIINSHSGNDWDFTVSGSRDNYYKSIQIQAVWQSPQLGLDWLEVE